MSKSRLHNYNVGYKHGYSGKELNQELANTYPGYYDGWHDGWSDMPSLEERIGIDIRKERSTACLD
jgi:hypothetical protein